MSEEEIVFDQAWHWHDPQGSGKYTIGDDQFFTMDGSHGRIQCNRLLGQRITEADSTVELSMQVTCGKVYHIVLYGEDDRPAADLRIDREGFMAFSDGRDFVDSGAVLTFQWLGAREWGDNSIGPTWWQSNRRLYAIRSTLHKYEFGGFDFQKGCFVFKLDGKAFEVPLVKGVSSIDKLELQTETVEPGTVIWLDHYAQTTRGNQVDYEDFPHFWNDWAVKKYYPQEKWHDSKLSMKEHRWLEVCTKYGDVVCRMPSSILKGSVTFEMMTTDVRQEIAFGVNEEGQRRGEEGGYISVMIYNGLWCSSGERKDSWEEIFAAVESGLIPPGGMYYYDSFDPPLQAENGKVYKVRMAWDNFKGTWRLWIDNELRREKGGDFERALNPLKRGMDMIRIHPGAHVYPHGEVYSYSYWGRITVREQKNEKPN